MPRCIIETLRAYYLSQLPDRKAELESALARAGSAPSGGIDAIRRMAHQLRGSGSSYGFPEISRLAAEVEDAPDQDVAKATALLIACLQHLASGEIRQEHGLLIVEDDPMMVHLLQHALAADNRTLEFADSARKAEEAVAAGRPDLILLDLILPDEDGRRVLRKWRAQPALTGVPILVVSAEVGPLVEAECLELGAVAFIRKPVQVEALAEVVAARLGETKPTTGALSDSRQEPAGDRAKVAKETGRILVADDDPLVASMVRHRLEQVGFAVDHAPDGGRAMELIEASPPRVAILDVKMPVMDGFEILSRLRSHPKTQRIPVLVLTVLGSETDLTRAFRLGADDYLLKPFSPSELVARVRRLAARA